MSRRQDADRAAAAGSTIERLSSALKHAAGQFRLYETLHTEAAKTSRELAEMCEKALKPPKAVTPEPDGWIECTLCGDAYYGDKAGCPYKDSRCPMKGRNPKPASSGQ